MEKTNCLILSFPLFYRHLIHNFCGLIYLFIWKQEDIISIVKFRWVLNRVPVRILIGVRIGNKVMDYDYEKPDLDLNL